MPIKSSRYYNDPAMAQAASNLASIFEPPSGSDAAGYARAAADDLQTGQRKALWDYMQRPDADQTILDRAGIISDLYDPSQSYYGVDVGAETQRYGYDQNLVGTKYTADTNAATSRSNNIADNLQKEAANKSDNLVKIIVEGYGNVGQGEVQPEIPLEVLEQFGGTTAVPEFKGPTKPMSETEVAGEFLRRLATGETEGITDMDVVKQAILGTELTPTIDPLTDQPVLKNRFEAAGEAPVLSAEEEKGRAFAALPDEQKKQSVLEIQGSDTYTAVNPDGTERSFVGYIGSDGRVYDQANSLKPAEGVVRKGSGGNQFAIDFDANGKVIGLRQGAGAGAKAPTDSMLRSGFAAKMSEESTKRLMAAYDDPALMPTATDMNIWPTLNQMARSESIPTASIGRFLNDQAMSPAGREFFLNLTNMLPYELMQKSGAATTQTDWATSLASAVPQPNDTPTMRQIRKERLETFIKATYGMAAGTPITDPSAPPAAASSQPAAPVPPEAAAAAQEAPAAAAAPDAERAATMENAKAAIAKGKPRAAIEARIKEVYPDFDPKELD